jgi:hypothetical protein
MIAESGCGPPQWSKVPACIVASNKVIGIEKMRAQEALSRGEILLISLDHESVDFVLDIEILFTVDVRTLMTSSSMLPPVTM